MSDLYTTEKEARANLSNSTRTGNFFQDAFTDTVSEGISLDSAGNLKREGLAWWLQGLTPGARSIAEQKEGIKDGAIIDKAVGNSQLTDGQIREQLNGGKLTSQNVRGTIAEAQRTRAEKPTPVQQATLDRGVKADERAVTAQQETTAARKDTNALLIAQMAQSDKNRLADRADARDARADDLMFRRETMERADRKEERNRRRDSIAALTSGLAALGAAFAL